MHKGCHFLNAILLGAATCSGADVFLTEGHLDITARYTSGMLTNVAILAGFPEEELEATNVVIVAGTNSMITVPMGLPPSFAPLGNAGDSLWYLPNGGDVDLPDLGISNQQAEAVDVEFRLLAVEAQCRTNVHFLMWSTDLGTATFFMNTRDGISDSDREFMPAGFHNHYNWAFTTSGIHRVTFQAVNTSLMLTSPPTTFFFHVLPLAPFETFQTNHWLSTAPLEIVGPAADPDGDGIPNLAEFAHATDPNHAGATNIPTYLLVNANGTNYGAVRFTRNKAATDVLMTAEMAPAPNGPWSTMTNLVSTVDQGATELVTYRDVVPVSMATNRFGRVRVEWKP